MSNGKQKGSHKPTSSSNEMQFVVVDAKENVVKAVSYSGDGKRQEVFFYAMPEEEFDELVSNDENSNKSYPALIEG